MMNVEKLEKLKKLEDVVRIGGKGSQRRKHKHTQRQTAADENRLQRMLDKLTLNSMPGIQQINLVMRDGSQMVMHYPKVQCALQSNVFVMSSESTQVLAPKQAQPSIATAKATMEKLQTVMRALVKSKVKSKPKSSDDESEGKPNQPTQPLLVTTAGEPNEQQQQQQQLKKKIKKTRIRQRARNKAMKADSMSEVKGQAYDQSIEEAAAAAAAVDLSSNSNSSLSSSYEQPKQQPEQQQPEQQEQEQAEQLKPAEVPAQVGDNDSLITASTGTEDEYQDAFCMSNVDSDELKSIYEDVQENDNLVTTSTDTDDNLELGAEPEPKPKLETAAE
ncbi:putative uncharacterized protein DDB_G0287113 [Drosophila busckii]|uniref:putative uncharacterized protein DDB_G0287113 n=1 Tax=Drosophila busckii TaxID=30019 RepID=UPI00083EEFB2|nr:putative uncharacterized protein DDB_G0287113 [Drosophila busckii]XP_017853066.1 putative uncharacterized protein DDB_G0287113 [Drosophila busckii]